MALWPNRLGRYSVEPYNIRYILPKSTFDVIGKVCGWSYEIVLIVLNRFNMRRQLFFRNSRHNTVLPDFTFLNMPAKGDGIRT